MAVRIPIGSQSGPPSGGGAAAAAKETLKGHAKQKAAIWALGTLGPFLLGALVAVLIVMIIMSILGGSAARIVAANNATCSPLASGGANSGSATTGTVSGDGSTGTMPHDPSAVTGTSSSGVTFTLPQPSGAGKQIETRSAGPIPVDVLAAYQKVAADTGVPWALLAAIGFDETTFNPASGNTQSSAKGLMQFIDGTWDLYGIDGSGDGVADRFNYKDSIVSAAHYLIATGLLEGTDQGVYDAIKAYNSNSWYTVDILTYAHAYGAGDIPTRASVSGDTPEVAAQIVTTNIKGGANDTGQGAGSGTAPSGGNDSRSSQSTNCACPVGAGGEASSIAGSIVTSAEVLTGAGENWAVPIPGARLSSDYGARWGTTHLGMDFAAPLGTPIYAVGAGTVVKAGAANGFGWAVGIQHSDGKISVYGHMHISTILVKEGDQVQAGQQIASVGNEGQSTGPHMHFEIEGPPIWTNKINPRPWLAARGIIAPQEGGTWPGTLSAPQIVTATPDAGISSQACDNAGGAAGSNAGTSTTPAFVPTGVLYKKDWPAESMTVADPSNPSYKVTPRTAAMVASLQAAGLTWSSMACWDPHAQNSASDHPLGLACDFMIDPNDPASVGKGWQIASYLIQNQPTLGVKYLIFQGMYWGTGDAAWKTYTSENYGCPNPKEITGCHYDHVHASMY